MAAITSAAVAGAGLAFNGYQAVKSAQDKKKAQRELNDYERQSLDNAYKNIQISTVGSDLMKEESARTTASLTDVASNSGIRGVLGALPKIQAVNNAQNQEARNYLDQQVKQRDYAVAGDETAIRSIKENRDNQNISALSSQINSADQNFKDSVYGALSSASSLTSSFSSIPKANNSNSSNRSVESVSSLSSQPPVSLTSNISPYNNIPDVLNTNSKSIATTNGPEEYNTYVKRNFRF